MVSHSHEVLRVLLVSGGTRVEPQGGIDVGWLGVGPQRGLLGKLAILVGRGGVGVGVLYGIGLVMGGKGVLGEGGVVPGRDRWHGAQSGLLAQLLVPRRDAISVGRMEEIVVGGVGVEVLGGDGGLVGRHVIGGHGEEERVVEG